MKLFKNFFLLVGFLLSAFSGNLFAQDPAISNLVTSVINVQKYERAIHIMAMLILGFGFLMVFVRKYGRSALTATFLLVSISLPVYFLIGWSGIFHFPNEIMERLIFAEFAAASLLITAGAVLGRLKMPQYLLLGVLFIFSYMLNEWLVLNGGLGFLTPNSFADTGGSIVIHAFGAIFGVAAAIFLTTKDEQKIPVESNYVSDRYSMLGSMVLWVFWPSFCAALVAPAQIPVTILNVIFALCGSTLATYFTSVVVRKKISIADIANASLAGGVAIGSTCDKADPVTSFIIGILAGILSTLGFAYIQCRMQKGLKFVDTCGVSNLHGRPGILGGLAAIPIVNGLNPINQLSGIGITIIIAVVAGLITGKIVSLMGKMLVPYDDASEFLDAE
ncbi:MAG: Rh family protein/ammonium transporter [Ignavibacteria bacterium]|nr:Rh family protein/ammonium transporter [Ignavibacteria bacterium]